jgi:hypothetical protein
MGSLSAVLFYVLTIQSFVEAYLPLRRRFKISSHRNMGEWAGKYEDRPGPWDDKGT